MSIFLKTLEEKIILFLFSPWKLFLPSVEQPQRNVTLRLLRNDWLSTTCIIMKEYQSGKGLEGRESVLCCSLLGLGDRPGSQFQLPEPTSFVSFTLCLLACETRTGHCPRATSTMTPASPWRRSGATCFHVVGLHFPVLWATWRLALVNDTRRKAPCITSGGGFQSHFLFPLLDMTYWRLPL